MANTIQLRRSATANAVPTTSQLALGELAINTFDGKLYLKKNDGTESIVEVGPSMVYPGQGIPNSTGSGWGTSYSVTGTGSVVLSESPTLTGTVNFSGTNFSAPSWTTAGIGIKQLATTYTNTTSSGTVSDIRINNFEAQTMAASNATTVTNLYGTFFSNPIVGANVTGVNTYGLGADSFRTNGILAASSTVTFSTTSATIGLGTSQTTGLWTAGGTSQTGTMTLGQSTVSQTTNIQNGATQSGSTKTINIGTGGLTGSTTNINVGAGGTSSVVVFGALQSTGALSTTSAGGGKVALTQDSGGAISLGNVSDTASSPYIDFNSGATTVDYDTRIMASGGTGTAGQGALSITTGTTTINGRVTFSSPGGLSAPAWTTNGIQLLQSAATYTDTTSTGTVADIRINNFASPTLAATNPITATIIYGTFFNDPLAGTNVTATNRFALGANSLRVVGSSVFGGTIFGAGIQASGGILFNTLTNSIALGTTQTTGLWTAGGPSQTGTITLGQSTVSQTTDIQAGVTASGSTKAINIGTNGAAGSTTNIAIGSTTGTSTTTLNGTVTLTKKIVPNVQTVVSAATITPNADTDTQVSITALAVPATIAIPSGTASDGQRLMIRFEDSGTGRALTWTTTAGGYRAIGLTLPTTTTAAKVLYVGCIYNALDGFWDVIAKGEQA